VTSHINFVIPIFNFSLLPDFDVKNGFTSKSGKSFKWKIGATRPLPVASSGQMSQR
jgi:hypothetical protein